MDFRQFDAVHHGPGMIYLFAPAPLFVPSMRNRI